MSELAKIINSYFLKFIKPIFKWSVIIGLVCIIGFGIGSALILPQISPDKKKNGNIEYRETPGGQKSTVYSGKYIPKNLNDEKSFSADQLIYQNQEDFYQNSNSSNEDNPKLASVQEGDKQRLTKLTTDFLKNWENYGVDSDLEEYRNSIKPYVLNENLEEVVSHVDDMRGEHVGPGKLTGVKPRKTSLYTRGLLFKRYDQNSAYAVLTAPVTYTGPSLQWSGRTFNRSYGFVFERENFQWKISRVAAQTIKEVEVFEPK